MTINDRIKEIIADNYNNNISEFCRIAGLKQGTISNILGARQSKPSFQMITSIALATNINLEWLITGEGEKYRSPTTHAGVPYWNLPVSAGRSITDIIGASKPDGYISGLPGADLAENILPIVGTSMEPEVSNGAIIGVKKMDNWDTLNTERIYLIITRNDRMMKRIEHDSENPEILWCVSPNYPRFKIFKSEVIEIHRVCFVYNAK